MPAGKPIPVPDAVAIGVGLVAGAVAWPLFPPLAAAVVLDWLYAPLRRSTVFLTFTGYYLAAARGLPGGFGEFYQGHGTLLYVCGVLVWAVSSMLLALPWIIVRPAVYRGWRRVVASLAGLALGFGLTIVPPLGLFAWCNPIFGFAAIAGLVRGPVAPPPGWVGVDTHLGMLPSTIGGVYARETGLVRITLRALARPGVRVVVLPETVAGVWQAGTAWVWRPVIEKTAKTGQTVLVGAIGEDRRDGADRRVDEVVEIHGGTVRVIRPDMMPVPVSMWHPWQGHHEYAMHLFSDPVVNINGKRVGLDICYEQDMPWTAISMLISGPQVVVGLTNDWWSSKTTVPGIEAVSLGIVGRLAGVPVVDAVNE